MDIVRDTKIDWLGLKGIFLVLSLALAAAGSLSMVLVGLNLGIDFTGGTLVYVKFREQPELERIREALRQGGLDAQQVIRFDEPSKNEVQIRMAGSGGEEASDLTGAGNRVSSVLEQAYDTASLSSQKFNLNAVATAELASRLQETDPEGLREQLSIDEFVEHYTELARSVVNYRTREGGLLGDVDALAEVDLPGPVLQFLRDQSYPGNFIIISVESVGPKVGQELRTRARDAVIFSLLGMLIYITFRFRPIYGLAAIVALFHDVFITVGAFSLTGAEISLTVVAALLTLVGYSINDTIVVFDRIRENLRSMRRADLATVINISINQTLNRTIMTSGMTFLAVFALYLLGGQVLRGFSFTLVIGIIVGTYSSIAVASPIVLWWQRYRERKAVYP